MRIIFFYLLLFLVFESCTDRSQIPIPAYLYIDKIELSTNPLQGSNSNAFKDAWVYVNDTIVGAFELPIKIPVPHAIQSRILVFAGIREDGILSHPTRYAFAAPYEINLLLKENKVDTLHPVVKYYDDIKFPFIENFDNSHFFRTDIDGDIQTQIVLSSSSDAFEGPNSGEIHLTKENPLLVVWYDKIEPIPVGPNKIYLELDYKCDMPFYIGFIGYPKSGAAAKDLILGNLNTKASWNKAYFSFRNVLADCECENYRMGIVAQYDSTNSLKEQVIHLDNIKVLYR